MDEEEECFKICCKNIPQIFFADKEITKVYFRQFGRFRRMIFKPKTSVCIVEYVSTTGVQLAIENGGEYDGHIFTIEKELPPPKKKKNFKEKDPDWLEDPEVRAELEAMGGVHVIPKKYNLRPEAMQVEVDKEVAVKSKPIIAKPRSSLPLLDTKKISTTPHKKNTGLAPSISSEYSDLIGLIKQAGSTVEEKYKILDARDKLIRIILKRKGINNAGPTEGTCPDMCPERERIMRVHQHQVALYEQREGGKEMEPRLAVKQYSRSSADQEASLPHELRPVSVLEMTMGYLMHQIMDLCDSPDVNLGEWFHFLWDRTRSIRKDITQQELCSQGSVSLVEQCARFHIHCSARLAGEDPSVFDHRINTENLTKCLQTLKYMYHDLQVKGESCANEAEFRSYIILLNLNDGNFMWEVQQLKPEIQKSSEVKFAMEVHTALDRNNFIKFFRLVNVTTYMNACILMRYFVQVRLKALRIFLKCYTSRNTQIVYPLHELARNLAFENLEYAIEFLEYCGVSVNAQQTHLILSKKSFEIPDFPFVLDRSVNVVESKRSGTVGEAICGAELPPKIFENHTPENSFDSDGFLDLKKYFNEEDFNFVGSDDENLRLKTKLKKQELKTSFGVPQGSNIFKTPNPVPPFKGRRSLPSEKSIFGEKKSIQVSKSGNLFVQREGKVEKDDLFKKPLDIIETSKIFAGDSPKSSDESIFGRKPGESKNIFEIGHPQTQTSIFGGDNENIFGKPGSNLHGKNIFGGVTTSSLELTKKSVFGGTITGNSLNEGGSAKTSTTMSSGQMSFDIQPIGFEKDEPDTSVQISRSLWPSLHQSDRNVEDMFFGVPNSGSSFGSTRESPTLPLFKVTKPFDVKSKNLGRENEELKRAEMELKKQEEHLKRLEEERHRLEEERTRKEIERKIKLDEELRKRKEEKEMEDRRKEEEKRRKEDERRIKEEERRRKEEERKIKEKQREEEKLKKLERKRILEIEKTVKKLIPEILNRVESIIRKEKLEKLNEKIKSRNLTRTFKEWRSITVRSKRKRKAADCTSVWVCSRSPQEEAEQLKNDSQDLTLQMMKRYRRGTPLSLDYLEDRKLEKFKFANISEVLVKRYLELGLKFFKEIYWKVSISLPDTEEMKNGLESLENTLRDYFEWKDKNRIDVRLERVKINQVQSVTYCIEKQNRSDVNFDSGGFIFVAKNFNEGLCQRILETLKGYGVYVQIPIVLILEEEPSSDTNFSELIEQEIIAGCLLLVDNFNAFSLVKSVHKGLEFLAKNVQCPPRLQMDTLKAFLMKNLCSEIWKKANSFSKWNSDYKNCLKLPNIVIGLYNSALDKLKGILNENCLEYETFPKIFKEFVIDEIPDSLPCDYKYFPDFYKDGDYLKLMKSILDGFELPKLNWWPPKDRLDLQKKLMKYCKSFENPERAFYKTAAVLLRNSDEDFDVKDIIWTDVIEVLAMEKINSTEFSLTGTKFAKSIFNQVFVIYDPEMLENYCRTDWIYVNNPIIKKQMKTFEFVDSEVPEIETISSADVEDVISRARKCLSKDSIGENFKKELNEFNVLFSDLEETFNISKTISSKLGTKLESFINE